MNLEKRLINKIYNKIDGFAKIGKDGIFDYLIYIDDIIKSGDYSVFSDVLLRKYNIDVNRYKDVAEVKDKTFDIIRFNTKSDFQVELKKIYDDNNVYQIGFDIYDLTSNLVLGQIKETEVIKGEYQAYKDTKLIELQDQIININLEVIQSNILTTIDDDTIPLLDKYKAALVILI